VMPEIEPLIARLGALNEEWWCPGSVDEADVDALELGLGVRLPNDYRRFLQSYGGGGITAIFELCMVERGNPLDPREGHVYGQTMHDRRELCIPPTAVVLWSDDEVAHYIDLSRGSDPPVTVFLIQPGLCRDWEPNFLLYLQAYLQRHITECEKHSHES